MPRLSFSLRDVFWLTLVVGMGAGWTLDHRRLVPLRSQCKALKEALEEAAIHHKVWYHDDGVVLDLLDNGPGTRKFFPHDKP